MIDPLAAYCSLKAWRKLSVMGGEEVAEQGAFPGDDQGVGGHAGG